METATLTITEITLDPRCQPRQRLDEVTVAEYVQAMRDGATFPPVTVYQEGSTYWLADGFHRITAANEAGLAAVPAKIETGGIRAAMLHAVGANATHGLRRSNADKRRAVETLIADPEWAAWSDREIARQCGVTHPFVAKMRREISGNGYHPDDDPELIEGRKLLLHIRLMEVEAQFKELERRLRTGAREMSGLLDHVKDTLSADQYRDWLKAEFGLSEVDAAQLREIADDDSPAWIDAYLDMMLRTRRVPAA